MAMQTSTTVEAVAASGPKTYGGGHFTPGAKAAPDIKLDANELMPPGCCSGIVWDAWMATQFKSLEEAGAKPPELEPYLSDTEFCALIKDVNYSIQWGIDQRKTLCPLFILLWCALGLGALLLYAHIFCFHYPKAKAEIEQRLKPLRDKGLGVEFVWAPSACGGGGAKPGIGVGFVNSIHILLPKGMAAA